MILQHKASKLLQPAGNTGTVHTDDYDPSILSPNFSHGADRSMYQSKRTLNNGNSNNNNKTRSVTESPEYVLSTTTLRAAQASDLQLSSFVYATEYAATTDTCASMPKPLDRRPRQCGPCTSLPTDSINWTCACRCTGMVVEHPDQILGASGIFKSMQML